MSRWHTPGCGARDESIRVDPNGLPHCQICKSSPDVPLLLSQLVAEGTGLQIPPDEPPGQLNLSWPPTVVYSRSAPTGDPAGSAARDLDAQSGADGGTSVKNNSQPISAALGSDKPSSPVYPSALSPDEFRLLVLDSRDTPAPGDETSHEWPVHVSLETYRDDDRPEYETVSYTWGGEDDDSSPSKPVYVGPHWDALFQTKNCHDMLRHLRPNRGIRFVWVDAICINQNDLDERAQQVAKMRTIYSNAWRVVVYLGSDIITPVPKPSFYPAKRSLDDVGISAIGKHLLFPDLSLGEVLERRYFSRIWIIQELLLSRQICIRIRDIELIIDRSAKANLLGDSHNGKARPSWNATRAPWMAYAAQGTVAKPAELLRMAQFSKASDPRDRVFGIMGMLQPSLSLVPDYSLSLVQTHIGFVSHILLNGNSPEILLHPGPRHMGQLPSWLPWPTAGDVAWRHPTQTMDESWEAILESFYRPQFPADKWSIKLLTEDQMDPRSRPGFERTSLGHDWRTGAHIEKLSGSLSIRLVHLMPLKTMPVQISHADGFTIVRLESPSKSRQRPAREQIDAWEFCLVFQDSPQPLDLVPGEDHIFILYPTSRHPVGLQFMIMRKVLGRPLAFRLVACCHRIFVCHRGGPFDMDKDITGLRRDFRRFMRDFDLFNVLRPPFARLGYRDHWVRLACLIYHGHRMSPAFPLDTLPGSPSDSAVLCALVAALNMLELDLAPRVLEFQGMDCLELHLSSSKIRGLQRRLQPMLTQMLSPRTSRGSLLSVRPIFPQSFGPYPPYTVLQICFWRRGDAWRPRVGCTTPPPPRIYTEIPHNKLDEVLEILIDMTIFPTDNMSSAYVLATVPKDVKEYIQGSAEPELRMLASMRQDNMLDTGEVREDSLTMAFKWVKALPPKNPDSALYKAVPGSLDGPDSTLYGAVPASWEADTNPDKLLAFPCWPRNHVDDFGIDGSTYQVTIV